MIILAGLAVLAGLVRLLLKGVRQPDRNLLDAIGVLAIFFAGWHVDRPIGGRSSCWFFWRA